ncbi:MAG: hypothetical protein IJL39_00460, partial [Clostridia bacterium]|nr:hypothetical protein [Clostridia bacterium]
SYAFQKFNADVVGGTWIPYSTTVGPYPFPALGRLFAAEFGKKLAAILDHPDAIVATMQNGESAVAAFAGYENSGATFVTVEEPVCQEFHGDYSGCLLLYMRYARKTEYSIAVSPIIANMWRMAKAIRLGADSYLEAEACDGICSASMRAFKLVSERLPDVASMIIVEGENEQVD